MNVASKYLCAELYELSGWIVVDDEGYWPSHWVRNDDDGKPIYEPDIPKYDLGYLLRKLPSHCPVSTKTDGSAVIAYYNTAGEAEHYAYADTPEDAACHLTIILFKHGILKNKHK